MRVCSDKSYLNSNRYNCKSYRYALYKNIHVQCMIEKVLEMNTTILWNVPTFQMREKYCYLVDFKKP